MPTYFVGLASSRKMIKWSYSEKLNCFWCGKIKKATRDHLIPRCANGTGKKGNLVPSCERCNKERGITAGLYYQINRGLTENLPLSKSTCKKIRNQIRMNRPIRNRWVQLEMSKLGYSPTRDMCRSLMRKAPAETGAI